MSKEMKTLGGYEIVDEKARNDIEEIKKNGGGEVTSVNGKTGAVELDAEDVGALPASTPIPSNTSDLNNNSGFITSLVSDLANYYNKSETYTQAEVRALVSAIPKFAISVVSALPTENISETTVYLLKAGTASGDLYTEYIFANGAWEILGSQRVDLTGYATEAWVNTKLTDCLTAETLTATIIASALGYTPANATSVEQLAAEVGRAVAKDELNDAIETALFKAKENGEFDGVSVSVSNVTESNVDGGNNIVTFSDGKTMTVKNGKTGASGANGTSVTVSDVSESTESGGNNTVTFSDGKTLTVKNGKNGTDGETPVRGTDYWTDADKEEIKSYVDDAILRGAW